jgi:hypothetical protein
MRGAVVSRDLQHECTTVTVVHQHFSGRPIVATTTVDGLEIFDLLRGFRNVMQDLGYAPETINRHLPPCES